MTGILAVVAERGAKWACARVALCRGHLEGQKYRFLKIVAASGADIVDVYCKSNNPDEVMISCNYFV